MQTEIPEKNVDADIIKYIWVKFTPEQKHFLAAISEVGVVQRRERKFLLLIFSTAKGKNCCSF